MYSKTYQLWEALLAVFKSFTIDRSDTMGRLKWAHSFWKTLFWMCFYTLSLYVARQYGLANKIDDLNAEVTKIEQHESEVDRKLSIIMTKPEYVLPSVALPQGDPPSDPPASKKRSRR